MDFSVKDKGVVGFGPFQLDASRRRLTRGGEAIKLPAKQLDTLLYFLENPNRIIEKDELLAAVWPGRIVGESSLTQAIFLLRRALQADEADRYIVTAPGRGYRFVADIVPASEGPPAGMTTAGSVPPAGMVQDLASPAQRTRLAKLSPPRLPATVTRYRLFAVLEQCRERKVIWVAGPPGAGKTTLVRSFLDDANTPCVWYVVDAGDGDPASFFYYLREAARDAGAQAAQLPLLTAEYLPDIAGYTRRFFRALIDRLPHKLVLVLDNFQEAGAAPVLNDILRDAAGELGPGARLIVISRQEPPAAFARLRANQELALLGWDALRLTEAETCAIVARQTPHLAPMAHAMHARSGGWAAGLTLLLESGRAGGDMHVAEVLETPQTLVDYFATELFARAPEPLRQLCLSTALLPRFTAGAAALLSGQEDAGALLEGLAGRRMFTDRYVTGEVYYQYHALFREFLFQQVERLYAPAARRNLAQRSARAAEAAGEIETALSLYETVGDWHEAARLLLARAPDLFAQGRWQTLQTWLSRQPAQSLKKRPWLTYWLGMCQGQIDPASGRATMEGAYQDFIVAGDSVGEILSVCAIVESHMVDWLDIGDRRRHWVEVLEGMLSQQPAFPSATMELRVHAVMLAGLTSFQPQHELVATCVFRVWQSCRQDIGIGERLMSASALVLSLALGATPTMARAAADEFDYLAVLPEATPLQRCTWFTARCYVPLLEGNFAGWAEDWQTAGRIAAEGGLHFMDKMCRLQYVWRPLLEGRLEDAEACLRAIEPNPGDKPLFLALHLFVQAWLALLQERSSDALRYAEEARVHSRPIGRSFRTVTMLNVSAHAHAACGQFDQALAIARDATSWFVQPGQSVIQLVSLLTEADILRGMGRRDEYLKVLAEAFATGRRGGHFVTIPWLPKVVTRLVATALEEGIEVDYVRQLVRQRNLPLPASVGWVSESLPIT